MVYADLFQLGLFLSLCKLQPPEGGQAALLSAHAELGVLARSGLCCSTASCFVELSCSVLWTPDQFA